MHSRSVARPFGHFENPTSLVYLRSKPYLTLRPSQDLISSSSARKCRLSNVASNEELNAGDVQITGDLSLLLRASRTGRGNGRNYDLTVECTDGAGNQTTAGVMIRVPHD